MRDPSLIKAVVRGKQWAKRLLSGEGNSPGDLAREAGVTTHYLMRLVRYAFLAPDITEAILAGTQSARITVESLREPIPLDWSEQRRLFAVTDR
jgi:site-specific DNA recombinase